MTFSFMRRVPYGADAVLLIVAALERRQLVDFYALAKELSLDVLIETHHERELDTVLEWIPEVRLIGINNRDLKTFTTDLTVTKRLAPRIPDGKLIVSESGIHQSCPRGTAARNGSACDADRRIPHQS